MIARVGVLLGLTVFSVAIAHAEDDCDSYYEGRNGQSRDFARAFDCFQRHKDWISLAIMQVNGEGTGVDLSGARASLERVKSKDADSEALGAIIKKREANPGAKWPRVDFCRDVAMTTPSYGTCQAREENKKVAKSDLRLKKMRAGLDAPTRPTFDRAQAAFQRFVKAEGDRVYQKYIDGTSRGQDAMAQEARARRNFMAAVKLVVTGPAVRLAGRRPFADADRELNIVYKSGIAEYVSFNEGAAEDARNRKDAETAAEYAAQNSDYKEKSRAAQHEWVRYRDAMAGLAAARWPEAHGIQDLARALVTEDRIRELRGK